MNYPEIKKLCNSPLINKSGIASMLYSQEINQKEISNETARKRLASKLSGRVKFSEVELTKMKEIMMELEGRMIKTEYKRPSQFEAGNFVQVDRVDFKIKELAPLHGMPATVLNKDGKEFTFPLSELKRTRLDDEWMREAKLKEGDVFFKDQKSKSEWVIKRTDSEFYVYYITQRHSNGAENPALPFHWVHDFQRNYFIITGKELVLKVGQFENDY